MPVAPPPPLTTAPVSAEVRLAYVLQHFQLAYPGAPAVSIGYAGTQPQVEIADLSGSFFEEIHPYPPAPQWRAWQRKQVPFFFANPSEKELIILWEGKAIISADIIAAAFYLLSGWQEYFSTERDRHGRFPYAASVQQQHNFVTLPVVNYYFDVLRTAVEHVSGQPLHPRRWGPQQAKFAAFISHDVDNLRSAWKAPAKTALRQGRWLEFGRRAWQHLTRPDAWDNLETVAAQVAQYGAKSTFFMLGAQGKAANNIPNADYSLAALLSPRLRFLKKQGCEVSLHGSIGTAFEAVRLEMEMKNSLQYEGNGLRFHYLSWEPRCTPTVVDASSCFGYDSTLGFAEHFGFRNSFCLPFYPFNFTEGRLTDFLEIPLNVMDTTLHHPNYLQLEPAEILPALQSVFAEVKRFGGVASVLWHNENFDPANEKNGPRQFHEIMAHLQQQGAAFLTGREVWLEFSEATGASIPNS